MTELDRNLPCPGCGEPVFARNLVARCEECGELQHLECGPRKGRCAAKAGCKGRTERAVVVKVPHEAPRLDEIESVVRRLVGEGAASLDARLDGLDERLDDLNGTTSTVHDGVTALGSRLSEIDRSLQAALAKVLDVARDNNKQLVYRPKALSEEQLSAAMTGVTEHLERIGHEGEQALERRLETLQRSLAPRLIEVARAIEACRFDVIAARHPAPWRTDASDVLAPSGATETEEEEL